MIFFPSIFCPKNMLRWLSIFFLEVITLNLIMMAPYNTISWNTNYPICCSTFLAVFEWFAVTHENHTCNWVACALQYNQALHTSIPRGVYYLFFILVLLIFCWYTLNLFDIFDQTHILFSLMPVYSIICLLNIS